MTVSPDKISSYLLLVKEIVPNVVTEAVPAATPARRISGRLPPFSIMTAAAATIASPAPTAEPASPTDKVEPGAGRQSYEDAKRQKNRQRAAEARFHAVETEIETAERELSDVRAEQERQAASPDYALLGSLYERAEALEKALDALYAEYEELDTELHNFG